MATYAIGDLQGCFETLTGLLAKLEFDRTKDKLWFVGDLVNRGPDSLACLRFVRDLGESASVVLGNHDLHLLALAEGVSKAGKNDTLESVLNAPDRDAILHWLRQQQLVHSDGEFVMVHAGLSPQWSLARSLQQSNDIEAALRGGEYREFLANMYGDKPDLWRDDLSPADSLRYSINAMTRVRVVSKTGRLDLRFKGSLRELPKGLSPWFDNLHSSFADKTIIAGHWSALGLHLTRRFIGIDTGCVWGRELTALRLEDKMVFQVPCAEKIVAKGWD